MTTALVETVTAERVLVAVVAERAAPFLQARVLSGCSSAFQRSLRWPSLAGVELCVPTSSYPDVAKQEGRQVHPDGPPLWVLLYSVNVRVCERIELGLFTDAKAVGLEGVRSRWERSLAYLANIIPSCSHDGVTNFSELLCELG